MLFGKLKKKAKFDKPLKENSLIFCPECRGRYGIRKWEREVSEKGLVCPRCRIHFGNGTLFVVDYFDREVETEEHFAPAASKKAGAKSVVRGTDKLIKKGESNKS